MKIMFNKSRPSPPAVPGRASGVRLTELCAGYPGRPVLRQLTCEIPALAVTALVGPNGRPWRWGGGPSAAPGAG